MTLLRFVLVSLLFLCFAPLHADTSAVHLQRNAAHLERYIASSDTNGLTAVLIDINGNLHLYRNKRYLQLFYSAARKAEEEKNIDYAQCLYTFTGLWHKYNNNLELAVDDLVKAYAINEQQGNKSSSTWRLVELGNIFFAEDEYEQASVFYNKALAIADEIKDHYALSVIYLNLGLVEHSKGNSAREIELLKKSSRERLLNKDPVFVSHTYVKLAEAYLELNNTDSSYYYLSEARKLYYSGGEAFGLLHEMPALLDLGEYNYHIARGDEKAAAPFLDSARSYSKKTELIPLYLQTYIVESKYLFDTKQYARLTALLEQKVGEFHRASLPDLERKGLHYLARAWTMLGNGQQAMQHYEKLITLEDSLKHTHYRSKLDQVRSITDLYQKDADLRLANQQLLYEHEKEKLHARQRDILWAFLALGFIVSVVLFVLMKRIQKQKKKVVKLHEELALQNEQVKENSLKLERSNIVKDKLFAIIGHDLRGPMNSLLGMVGLMRSEMAKSANTSLETHFHLMENTLKETVDLFERLLQWSKLDKKEIHFNPVVINIEEMVNKVLRFYEPALRHKKIEVVFVPCGNDACADHNMTHTILRNLVANAINALPEGKSIYITAQAKSKSEMVISVRDNGYGFMPAILQRFADEEAANAASSNGLGLVLSRELARMNRGSLTIGNHDTGGAEICFTLPMLEKAAEESVPQTSTVFSISSDWKLKLEGLSHFKVYQATQVKTYISSIGETGDEEVQRWLSEVEKAVFFGSRERYEELVKMIEN